MSSVQVHVISKHDNAQHTVFQLEEEAIPLAESSVRVRTFLISLTSNNLTYARGGTRFGWWDAYPVPQSAPPPYNSQSEWGIVSAWGYGRVVESKVTSIISGSLLWGMWPTSSHAVDLQLEATMPTGHWCEVSKHRKGLMTVYNNYEQYPASGATKDKERMAMTCLWKPLWVASHLLNLSVFSAPPNLHPLGLGDHWSEEDSDLSLAVVISLSASSKTGRNFSWQLAKNRNNASKGPLALLQLTSAPEVMRDYPESALAVKAARYEEFASLTGWVADFRPTRIVIVDFGAAVSNTKSIASIAAAIASSVSIIAVGYEAKIYSSDELKEHSESSQILKKVQLNTSGLRDRTKEAVGIDEFYGALEETWERWIEDGGSKGVSLRQMKGVRGRDGIEGAWQDLCDRRVAPDTGIVITLP
ncbi:hypothetical protein BJ875DRAFT_476411 [Amylocarpus encephaloides]|uniref:Uncharacterized protein n=1 Tax=Amylocarpus encephaloides TaxID=45428 RepID=A0A9P7Y8M9_9HELO|nr:hypothetical protein BJ875DRAFT_476411 [Amylocarpus encephaloides]